jgi:uncharacterized protein (TIGR02266 family)
MRSTAAPRIQHDATVEFETVEEGEQHTGRSLNLSVGGVFVRSETILPAGAQIDLKVGLGDGGAPIDARGRVVWAREEAQPGNENEQPQGMAVRFVGLSDVSMKRIQRLIASGRREPTGVNRREVRIKLPSLSAPLRAVARDQTEEGLMLEAELPWLRLGSQVTAELGPETVRYGLVSWVGLDVTRAGAARLRIAIDLNAEAGPEGEPAPLSRPRLPSPGVRKRLRWPWLAGSVLAVIAAATGAWFLRPLPQPLVLPSPPVAEAPAPGRAPSRMAIPKEKPELPAKPEPPRGRRHKLRK